MIAQDFLARLGAIIIRYDIEHLTTYLVLVESLSMEYCWDCLHDAIQDYSGHMIGWSTLTISQA